MGKRSREKRERIEKEETNPRIEKKDGVASIFLGIVRWGTYLSLFTPLIVSGQFFFPFVGPKSLYFMGLAQIIFFAWLILILYLPQYRPRLNILTLILIIFLAILILSAIFGVDPSRSFWSKFERMTGLLMWFHLIAFFLVISSVFKTKEDWSKIFSVSIFAAILVALLSLFPNLGGEIFIQLDRGEATIGNSSFMGVYLLFNIFFALWLLITSSSSGLKIYSILSLIFMIPALFLSGALAAAFSFLGGLAILLFLYLIFIPKKRYLRVLGKILFVGSFLVFLISIFFIFQPDNIIHQKFIEKTTLARLMVWEKAWEGFLERPLLGWGPENFDFIFAKHFNSCMFLPECGGEIWFDRAHNIVLDTLVTTGIFGFLGYLGIFVSTFYLLWKKFFQKIINFWTPAIFSAILISYFVQNLTVFDMVNSYLMFFLVLGFIGSITSIREAVPSTNYQTPPPGGIGVHIKLLLIAILILFSFSFFKFVFKPLQADYYVVAAVQEKPGSEEKLSLYKKTLETSPLGKYQIRDFFAQNTLEVFESSARNERLSLEEFRPELDFVSQELEKSIKEAPLDFRNFLKLGQIYNAYALIDSVKIPQAEEVLKEAIALSPTNQQGYWALAQTKIYQGNFQEALSLAEKAIELEPRVSQSHLIVIQIAKIKGDYDLAKKKVEEAIKINPAWEPGLQKLLNP